jgi:hypothetical protein
MPTDIPILSIGKYGDTWRLFNDLEDELASDSRAGSQLNL